MRRVVSQKLRRCASSPSAFGGTCYQASTKASSRMKCEAQKSPTASSRRLKRSKTDVDGQQAVTTPPSDRRASPASSPERTTSSATPSWVRNTLHYNEERVQQLANLLSGVPGDIASPVSETPSTGAGYLSSGAKSVEEQLRQPGCQSTDRRRPAKSGTPVLSRDRPTNANRDASAATRRQGKNTYMGASLLNKNWSSILLDLPKDSATAALVRNLLSLPTARMHSQGHACASSSHSAGTTPEQETLSALLRASRLHWHVTSQCAAPFLLSSSVEKPLGDNVHHLCVVASALEASLKSLREADGAPAQSSNGAATTAAKVQKTTAVVDAADKHDTHVTGEAMRDSVGAAQQRKEWQHTCVTKYSQLLTELLTRLITELAAYNSQQQQRQQQKRSLSSSQVRIDVLLSAVLSLLHALDICAISPEELPDPAAYGRTENASSQHTSATVAIQCSLLEQLCAEVVVAMTQPNSTLSSSGERSETSADRFHALPSPVAAVLSTRKQLTNLQAKLKVLPSSSSGQGCIQGVVSITFLFYVVVLRRALAEEVSAVHATVSVTPDGANSKETTGPQRQGIIFSGNEMVELAKQAETLLTLLHPQQDLSQAALATMQHRTTSPALSNFLSLLWRHSTKVQAAQSRWSRASSSSISTDASRASKGHTDTASPSATLLSPASRFWEQHPTHLALLLSSYYDLLAVSGELLPMALDDASAEPSSKATLDLSWVVPYYSRVIRIGMALQMDAALLAAAHLGLEAFAPRSPDTPLEKVVALRLKSRRAKKLNSSSATGRSDAGVTRAAVKGSGSDADARDKSAGTNDEQCAETDDPSRHWARVFRLSGGVRVACCETLYRAVVNMATLCSSDRTAAARLVSAGNGAAAARDSSPSASFRSSSAHNTTPPAIVLVHAVSRVLFCVPRTEYLLGLYTDELLSAEAAAEQSRRVYIACGGVFLWLRELSPPFDTQFARTAPPDTPSAAAVAEAALPAKAKAVMWLVCGTTKANALEAAFFLTYLLYHWPSLTRYHYQQPLQPQAHGQGVCSHAAAHEGASPFMRALSADGVAAAMPPTPVDSFISATAAESYVAETLFFLQHDTASLLRHVRITDRFHYFSGEKRDKTKLMEESALQRRHVTSTLSVVRAYEQQPNFVWMPLETAQEVLFQLSHFPGLLVPATPEGGTGAALTGLRSEGDEEAESAKVMGSHGHAGVQAYTKVQVGTITCTFARAHGYLVRRLHVLGGILREYRSLLLSSPSPHDKPTLPGSASPPPRVESSTLTRGQQNLTSTKASATPSSFSSHLVANAAHAPQDECHRRNNYRWANPWATMLREDFASLPAEMEGSPTWTIGVLRTMERMELMMYDAHRRGLFMNVAKSQRQYRLQKQMQSNEMEPSGLNGVTSPEEEDDERDGGMSELHEASHITARKPLAHEICVTRASRYVPLGVALDGNGCVLRVQETVSAPTAAGASYGETEEVTSPFAAALARCPAGRIAPAEVIGHRITAVDGVAVENGRAVAAQVQDKTTFALTFEE
ncbi:hypothetical protein ABB37_01244 [Leptomonas pyrrhocoris]|uniref:Uncharacterized protein n=1 Tax=Leptomonas pyrrhocoris TaxID=157538 RepID=A0A0N0DZ19_LEPPY|nr:hypothetical protein ABB37_01244 [Leptomonas pyrrhocoris]KPA84751.1 hypothetical protein ABB37_01244 [Leptomonas pyrrhocoris]|eukprot:XP_015663190.1 hypothetical protein ABB37_01244 [Leptomonas pyrrhocoris]